MCLALCFAAAQAGLVGVQNAVTYSAGVAVPSVYNAQLAYNAPLTYNAPLAYNAPLTYSGYPSVYSAGLAAPSIYNNVGFASPLVRSAYAAPTVYSSPIIANTLLKK